GGTSCFSTSNCVVRSIVAFCRARFSVSFPRDPPAKSRAEHGSVRQSGRDASGLRHPRIQADLGTVARPERAGGYAVGRLRARTGDRPPRPPAQGSRERLDRLAVAAALLHAFGISRSGGRARARKRGIGSGAASACGGARAGRTLGAPHSRDAGHRNGDRRHGPGSFLVARLGRLRDLERGLLRAGNLPLSDRRLPRVAARRACDGLCARTAEPAPFCGIEPFRRSNGRLCGPDRVYSHV
ncbi:MAG: hypothetical protein AVDCRST_MAG90-1337, partial [uncultured Microvirga sp.]